MGETIGAAILLALLVATASAQESPCAAAMERFRQKEWSGAAAAFAECEQNNPGKTDALLFRGKSLVNLQKYDEAATALQSYARLHPQSDDAAYLLAYIAFRENKPKQSLDLFTSAAKLKPPTANDLKIVALDYVLLADYGDAAHYLELSLQMNPDDAEARYHLGRVRYQQNQFDAAIAAFQEVIKREPDSVKAHDNLGLCYEAKNQVASAIAAYKQAIELDKADPSHSEQPYLNLGALLSKSDRVDEAIPFLLRAEEITPSAFKVRYELGKAYFDSNHIELALPQAEEAVKLAPAESSGHYLLGRIYQRQGKAEPAKEQFRLTSQLIHDKDAKSQSGMASGASSH
jgi:tetratricopeptide (TPR) repeat protein